MPTHWIVSSHGSIKKTATVTGAKGVSLVHIPHGVTMHFFIPENKIFYEGWPAYNALMNNPPKYNSLANIDGYNVFKAPAIPDYVINGDESWIDNKGLSASGIFIAGDTFHADPRTLYVKNTDSMTVGDFFSQRQWQMGDQVFWLACRQWY